MRQKILLLEFQFLWSFSGLRRIPNCPLLAVPFSVCFSFYSHPMYMPIYLPSFFLTLVVIYVYRFLLLYSYTLSEYLFYFAGTRPVPQWTSDAGTLSFRGFSNLMSARFHCSMMVIPSALQIRNFLTLGLTLKSQRVRT